MKKSFGVGLILTSLLMTLLWVFAKQVIIGPKILLILSHYDDETMIAATLMKLKSMNADIRSIYLTKGEGGKDIRIKDPSYFSSEQKRIHALIVAREIDISKSASLLGAEYFQIGLPDTPLRIPEVGYANPLGRPTTDLNKFLLANIWDMNLAKQKIQALINSWKWNPDYIFTTGNDQNIIHAHHQATYMIVQDLLQSGIFDSNLKGAFAILEGQHYPLTKFPLKNKVLLLDHSEKISIFNSATFIEQGYELYLAHKSQPTSQRSLEELREIPEMIYLIHTDQFSNRFDEFILLMNGHTKMLEFTNSDAWMTFFLDETNWKIGRSKL
jgi:LmbE family N-acetylglucosaminyl deacetylase